MMDYTLATRAGVEQFLLHIIRHMSDEVTTLESEGEFALTYAHGGSEPSACALCRRRQKRIYAVTDAALIIMSRLTDIWLDRLMEQSKGGSQ